MFHVHVLPTKRLDGACDILTFATLDEVKTFLLSPEVREVEQIDRDGEPFWRRVEGIEALALKVAGQARQ